jgi:hypothetical protein
VNKLAYATQIKSGDAKWGGLGLCIDVNFLTKLAPQPDDQTSKLTDSNHIFARRTRHNGI